MELNDEQRLDYRIAKKVLQFKLGKNCIDCVSAASAIHQLTEAAGAEGRPVRQTLGEFEATFNPNSCEGMVLDEKAHGCSEPEMKCGHPLGSTAVAFLWRK